MSQASLRVLAIALVSVLASRERAGAQLAPLAPPAPLPAQAVQIIRKVDVNVNGVVATAEASATGGQTSTIVPPPLAGPRLEMVNGDYYSGSLLDSDHSDSLLWQCDAATTPFQFDLKLVSAAHFPRHGERPRAAGDFCFELVGGDVLFGSLVGLSADAIDVETTHFGRLHIVRSQVRRVQRWGDSSGIEYLGPEGLHGWTPAPNSGTWREEAGHIVADEPGSVTLNECPLPAQAGVEVELSWKNKPDFSLSFGTGGADLRAFADIVNNAVGRRPGGEGPAVAHAPAFELSVWSGSLVLVREAGDDADLAPVQKLGAGAGRVALQLYFDEAKGEVAAYSIEGKQLCRVKVAGAPGVKNFGVRLTNKRGDVRLERLAVRKWSGAAPTEVPADRPYVQRVAGEVLFADELSYDADKREIIVPQGEGKDAERVPAADVATIVLPSPVNGAPAAVRAALHDGVRVSGTLDGITGGKVRITRPGVDAPLDLPVADLQSLVALAPSAPPPPPAETEGRLETAGVKSRGKLVDAEATDGASCLAWKPYGSETASALRPDLSGKIVYREPPPQPAQVQMPPNARVRGRVQVQNRVVFWGLGNIVVNGNEPQVQIGGDVNAGDQLLWLRAGDRIPCKLLRIDERGVTFETPFVESTFLPHDAIKAWDRVAGSQPRVLDELKRNRLLTLPRMQRNNPPTHLIESTSGDFLRGRLESMDAETVTIEVRLEKKRIPRSKIARIIWFEKPTATASDKHEAKTEGIEAGGEGDAAAAPAVDLAAARGAAVELAAPADASETPRAAGLRVQVVRSDGVRLTFEPQRFAEGELKGTSDLLGACQAPIAKIDQLLLGGAIAEAAAELAYAQWRLLAAADPKFVSEGDQPGAAGGGGMTGTESPLVGKPAPEIRLDMLDGEKFTLSSHQGKVVVLDFWATWCGWCMQSMPEIAAMAEEFGDRVVLMPINQQEDKKTIAAGLERLKLEPKSALDVDGAASEHFQVSAIPQTVIVGPDGKVTHVFVGGGPGVVDQLRQAIKAALGEAPEDGPNTENESPAAAE